MTTTANTLKVNVTEIEKIETGSLIPYAKNSRTHSPQQVAQIAASIREFGFTNPVLVADDLTIIAGHGRVLAAQSLGLDCVPCLRLSHLDEHQRRAYVLADNRLALNAGWDDELLALELGALRDDGFDLDLLGFEDAELRALLEVQTIEEEGAADEAEESVPVVSVEGDMWLLGSSRVICGSSTDADVVARLLEGCSPGMMVTDPPYGVEYEPNWRQQLGKRAQRGEVANDEISDWREAWALFPGAVAYVWHSDRYSAAVYDSLTACDFEIRSQLIWNKSRFAISRGHYHWKHEPCWYSVRKGASAKWSGDRKQCTVWDIETEDLDTGHGTQKPLECMLRPMRNHGHDVIYDPFLGSGTTIIAAESIGRSARGCELNPVYVDVIVRRWQQATGGTAVIDGDGRSFAEVEGAREGRGDG